MKTINEPPAPICRMVVEGTFGSCSICHSTEVSKYRIIWISFGKKIGCINPKCANYYKQKT